MKIRTILAGLITLSLQGFFNQAHALEDLFTYKVPSHLFLDPAKESQRDIRQYYSEVSEGFHSPWVWNAETRVNKTAKLADSIAKVSPKEIPNGLQENVRSLMKDIMERDRQNNYGKNIAKSILYKFYYDSGKHERSDLDSMKTIFSRIGQPEDLEFISSKARDDLLSKEVKRDLYSTMFAIIKNSPENALSKHKLWSLLDSLKYESVSALKNNTILKAVREHQDELLARYKKINDTEISSLIEKTISLQEKVFVLERNLSEVQYLNKEQFADEEAKKVMVLLLAANGGLNSIDRKNLDLFAQQRQRATLIEQKNTEIKKIENQIKQSLETFVRPDISNVN